jgi:hypothetical protein
MKRSYILYLLTISLVLFPVLAEAGHSRFYVRFSVGGAVLAGGGFLVWNLTYSSRINRNNMDSKDSSVTVKSKNNRLRPMSQARPNDLHTNRLIYFQPLDLELPLLVLQW